MRTTMLLLLGAGLLAARPLRAQDDGDPAPRALELRRRIEDRFAARVQEDLGLTDQQASKLRQVMGSYFVKRRGLEADERRFRTALAAELRPGVAANKDNVARLVDQLLENKVRYVQSYRDEVNQLAEFLDPVQRAQFLILRQRLLDRVQEVRDEAGGPRRPRP